MPPRIYTRVCPRKGHAQPCPFSTRPGKRPHRRKRADSSAEFGRSGFLGHRALVGRVSRRRTNNKCHLDRIRNRLTPGRALRAHIPETYKSSRIYMGGRTRFSSPHFVRIHAKQVITFVRKARSAHDLESAGETNANSADDVIGEMGLVLIVILGIVVAANMALTTLHIGRRRFMGFLFCLYVDYPRKHMSHFPSSV